MKINWKKVSWWGGGFLLGGAAYLVVRQPRAKAEPAPEFLPEGLETLLVRTEPIDLIYRSTPYRSYAIYRCQQTLFKVWSFLSSSPGDLASQPSARIFHITPEIHFVPVDPASEADEEIISDERFYATLQVPQPRSSVRLANCVQRGRHLEFHRCSVGGSLNGVETGEKTVTLAPVADYHFTLGSRQ
ncbi:MAG: hypothetical protein ACR2L2_13780 [Acidobacteriota bacterium]